MSGFATGISVDRKCLEKRHTSAHSAIFSVYLPLYLREIEEIGEIGETPYQKPLSKTPIKNRKQKHLQMYFQTGVT